MHERDYQLRNAKRTKKPEDWINYRRLRNRTTCAIRKAKANYERSIFMENDMKPKDFWKQIKKCYPVKDKPTVSKSFTIENELVSDKQTIANAFYSYFTHIASRINSSIPNFVNSAW